MASLTGLKARLAFWRKRRDKAQAEVNRKKKQLKAWHPTKTSAEGMRMLKREEGVVPYAYNDPAGHATFGVGHLIHLGHVTATDQRVWGTKANPKPGLVDPTLRMDIIKYETAVLRATNEQIKGQAKFDACVSLAFNIGTGGFETSSVALHIRQGHMAAAADAFLLWKNPNGILLPRRKRERTLFLTGKYPE